MTYYSLYLPNDEVSSGDLGEMVSKVPLLAIASMFANCWFTTFEFEHSGFLDREFVNAEADRLLRLNLVSIYLCGDFGGMSEIMLLHPKHLIILLPLVVKMF